MDVKIANLRAKLARRNNSMKSQSQLDPHYPESPMVNAGAIVAFSGGNKKTGKREGLLRMVNSIGQNDAERLEAEEKKLQVLNRNLL
jgi:glutaminase